MTATMIRIGEKDMERYRAEASRIEAILMQYDTQTAGILLTIVCVEIILNIDPDDGTPPLQLFEEFADGVRMSLSGATASPMRLNS